VVTAGFAACLFIGVQFWYTNIPLVEFSRIVLTQKHVWEAIGTQFLGCIFFGPAFGALTALFSRGSRRPYVLASVWATILGSTFLCLQVAINGMRPPPESPAEIAFMIGVVLAVGAVYGFSLGVFILMLEAVWRRMQLRRAVAPPASSLQPE
jgi:hypothetical protein